MTTSFDVLREQDTPLTRAVAKRLEAGDLGPVRNQSPYSAALDIVCAGDDGPDLIRQHEEVLAWRRGEIEFESLCISAQIYAERERALSDLAEKWEARRAAKFEADMAAGVPYREAADMMRDDKAMAVEILAEEPVDTRWPDLEAWIVAYSKAHPDLDAGELIDAASKLAPRGLVVGYVRRWQAEQAPEKPAEPDRPGWKDGKPQVAMPKAEKHSAETFGYWQFNGTALVDNAGEPLAVSDTGLIWDAGLARWRTQESMVADWQREHPGGG